MDDWDSEYANEVLTQLREHPKRRLNQKKMDYATQMAWWAYKDTCGAEVLDDADEDTLAVLRWAGWLD